MDIAILGNKSIKVKGKQVTFVVDPTKEMPKTPADAVILLNGVENIDISRVVDSRIILNGPGGYEVGGAKISGTKTAKGILYKVLIDGISVVLGSTAENKVEGFEGEVVIINTDSDFNEAFVTALEPKMIVLYGDKKTEAAKALGVESISMVSKVTIAKDKFAEKMEIVVLN